MRTIAIIALALVACDQDMRGKTGDGSDLSITPDDQSTPFKGFDGAIDASGKDYGTGPGCGGALPPCADGKSCNANSDCVGMLCIANVCYSPLQCIAPMVNCDGNVPSGCNVDLDTDIKNCGKCGVACGLNQVCSIGRCTCGVNMFLPKVDYATDMNPNSVAVGDLDGDGKPDLVLANEHDLMPKTGSVSVLLNKGGGVFAAHIDYPTGAYAQSVALADLDGDGALDVVTANANDNTVSVLLNAGGGVLGGHVDYPVGANPSSVAIGDVDGDGRGDLVVANYQDTTVSVLLNMGGGQFAPKTDYMVGMTPNPVALADLDGDGLLDIAIANGLYQSVTVLWNKGGGAFVAATMDVREPCWWLAIGDIDGDGKPDLAFPNVNEGLINPTWGVFLNQGGDAFLLVQYRSSIRPYAVTLGDLDGDGKLDLVFTNQQDNTLSVILNQGNGAFAANVDYPTGGHPGLVALGDFDGNGRLDLAVANGLDSTVSVLLAACK